jgi:hypothetical protein
MKAWADRNSTALIICATILLVVLMFVVFVIGLGVAEGEGGIVDLTTTTTP